VRIVGKRVQCWGPRVSEARARVSALGGGGGERKAKGRARVKRGRSKAGRKLGRAQLGSLRGGLSDFFPSCNLVCMAHR
jgi:hypothetical protein